jgi:hypothetical protein
MIRGLMLCSVSALILMGCQIRVAPPVVTDHVERITGQYMQWSGGCVGAPPRSRSDWMLIHAQYGCVYVHGAAPPAKRGNMVQIDGVWQVTPDGRRYVERR